MLPQKRKLSSFPHRFNLIFQKWVNSLLTPHNLSYLHYKTYLRVINTWIFETLRYIYTFQFFLNILQAFLRFFFEIRWIAGISRSYELVRTFSTSQCHWGNPNSRDSNISRHAHRACGSCRKNKRGQSTHARNTGFGLVNPPSLSLPACCSRSTDTIDPRDIFTIRKRLRALRLIPLRAERYSARVNALARCSRTARTNLIRDGDGGKVKQWHDRKRVAGRRY